MIRQHAVDEALAQFDKRRSHFLLKLEKGLRKIDLPRSQRRVLDDALGGASMADLQLRRHAVEILVRRTLKLWHRRPQLTFYTGTFCWEQGFAPDTAATFDLPAMQRRVDKALRKVGLDAICAFDLDVICATKDQPRRLCVHVHAFCFTDGEFKPKNEAKALRKGVSFRNPLDAPAVVFRRIADGAEHIARAAAYLLKQTPNAKRIAPRKPPKTGNCLLATDTKFPPRCALRAMEFWSHVTLADAVFAVGAGGRRLRRQWITRVKRHYGSYPSSRYAKDGALTPMHLRKMWAEAYQRLRRCRFEPLVVRTRSGNYQEKKQLVK